MFLGMLFQQFYSMVDTVIVACCRPILKMMYTPEDIFKYAYAYIAIIFLGIPAIIRSLGDSRSPVIFLAIASGINIVLDIVFIVVFHMGAEGPALAMVIAQGISGILSLLYMKKILRFCAFRKRNGKCAASI